MPTPVPVPAARLLPVLAWPGIVVAGNENACMVCTAACTLTGSECGLRTMLFQPLQYDHTLMRLCQRPVCGWFTPGILGFPGRGCSGKAIVHRKVATASVRPSSLSGQLLALGKRKNSEVDLPRVLYSACQLQHQPAVFYCRSQVGWSWTRQPGCQCHDKQRLKLEDSRVASVAHWLCHRFASVCGILIGTPCVQIPFKAVFCRWWEGLCGRERFASRAASYLCGRSPT